MKLLYIFLKLGHCNVYQLILSCNPHSLARIKRDYSRQSLLPVYCVFSPHCTWHYTCARRK